MYKKKKKAYALVDCNSFYASCEKVFRPDLRNIPVIVMSNNDGCAIARCPLAKSVGIKMGEPVFKIKHIIKKYRVALFSANFTLYGNMSARVMQLLAGFTPDLEIYSIDEAFLILEEQDLVACGREIKRTVTKGTGIPVCVGIGKTKTLAKLANHIAKKYPEFGGVCDLTSDPKAIAIMKQIPVNDIWGIGSQYSKMLNRYQIVTVEDFIKAPTGFVQKKMTIMGRRTQEELQGHVRIALEDFTPKKKSICTSRSFGKNLTNYTEVEEALCTFVDMAAAQLRRQKSVAAKLTVFVHTNPFKDTLQYYKRQSISLPQPTNSTVILARYARFVLKQIFLKTFIYKKCGVILDDFCSQNVIQSVKHR